MPVSNVNRDRYRAKLLSRQFKWVFEAVPDRWKHRITGWLWRQLFLSDDGKLHLAGEHVLADLREFADPPYRPLFSSDPLVMARRVGRREVFQRIVMFLNLDEATVQYVMELDDGLGE
jgi:hypothetical protein